MKIIVLGMDNTGKTTLCKSLSKKLKYKLINSLGKGVSKEIVENYLLKNLNSNENMVFERFTPFEEMIYGNILRGYSEFDFNNIILQTLKNTEHIIIYCRPDNDVIFNWGTREQMEGVIEKSQKLLNAWDKLIDSLNDKVIKWDYTKTSLEELLKNVI